MEVNLKRGANSIATINATSEIVDLTPWKAQMRPGDIIVCSIKTVVRKTFLNEDDKVDFPEYVFIPMQ